MSNIYIPSGEKDSINDLARRALNDDDGLIMEIYGKPKVCLNVISTLEEYAGSEIALKFAKKLIDF